MTTFTDHYTAQVAEIEDSEYAELVREHDAGPRLITIVMVWVVVSALLAAMGWAW